MTSFFLPGVFAFRYCTVAGRLPLSVVFHRRQREDVGLVLSVGRDALTLQGCRGSRFPVLVAGRDGQVGPVGSQVGCRIVRGKPHARSRHECYNRKRHERRERARSAHPEPFACGVCAWCCEARLSAQSRNRVRLRPPATGAWAVAHLAREPIILCDDETLVDFWPASLTRRIPPAAPGTLEGARARIPRQQIPRGLPRAIRHNRTLRARSRPGTPLRSSARRRTRRRPSVL